MLPLTKPIKSKKLVIGITGPAANDTNLLKGGKSDFCPGISVTPLDGLVAAAEAMDSVEVIICSIFSNNIPLIEGYGFSRSSTLS